MANPEGNAHRIARAQRLFLKAARESGNEDQLAEFYRESNINAFDAEEQHSNTLLAAAKLFARAAGIDPEDEDLAEEHDTLKFTDPESGELYEKKVTGERVQEINASQGQGPLPEDAEAGDSHDETTLDPNAGQTASEASEEEREELDEGTPSGPDSAEASDEGSAEEEEEK